MQGKSSWSLREKGYFTSLSLRTISRQRRVHGKEDMEGGDIHYGKVNMC